tara:strand:+ start:306 stop:2321 length:2016 start_codon:yes stop_codon:yes gene_type:complete
MGLINIRNNKLLKGNDWSYLSEDSNNWYFPWLLSDFKEKQWKVDSGEKRTITVNFDDYIPSTGETLCNPKYSLIVNTIKKVIALSRTGHLAIQDNNNSVSTNSQTMYLNAISLKTLALFLIKTYGGKSVAEKGFNLLKTADISQFHLDIATGRADKATGLTDSIIKKINSLGEAHLTAILNACCDSQTPSISIKNFLQSISIGKTSISETTTRIIKEHLIEILPGFTIKLGEKKQRKKTEYPNCCPPKITTDDTGIGDTTFAALTNGTKLLKKYYLYIPELENYSNPIVSTDDDFSNNYIKLKERTPNIPTYIALNYLNEAIKLIAEYGEHIVATKQHCDKELNKLHKKYPKLRRCAILEPPRVNQLTIPENKFTKDYNVTRYNELPTNATFDDKRENVTVLFAYKMLRAATYILIHTFCIKRISEVLNLKESNLEHGLWGGYEIFFGIKKAAPTENSLLLTGRPIPNIVAEGYDYLIEANSHLFGSDEDIYIFTNGNTSRQDGGAPSNQKMSNEAIINNLKDFADFIKLPTMTVNGIQTRYYLSRTHILRRFGAKAYYSYSDLSDFPALTWLMGHRSTEETWRYLLEEVTNDELCEEEATAIVEALYKSDINTGNIKAKIELAFNIKFNNLSPELASNYIQEQIKNGAKVYAYTNQDTGENVLYMELNDE